MIFEEVYSFNKPLLQNILTVKVYDKERLKSDELFGECHIDLHAPDMVDADDESQGPQEIQTHLSGKRAGKVLLRFSRKATPPKPTPGM